MDRPDGFVEQRPFGTGLTSTPAGATRLLSLGCVFLAAALLLVEFPATANGQSGRQRSVQGAGSEDWRAFRGTDGKATSAETGFPITWSDSANLSWKLDLPGPGSSSPVVTGDYVFVTAYSGYGVDRGNLGRKEDLKRHLLCIDRKLGEVLWSRTVSSTPAEDPYRGFVAGHGYASSTPVTDGERVFVFFGKAGVLAFDMAGERLWRIDVGQGSSLLRTGSGASPVLYRNLVIVNASDESQSIRALDKDTGREVWRREGGSLTLAFGTPALADHPDGRAALMLAVSGKVVGLDPDNGTSRWWFKTNQSGSLVPSVVFGDDVVFAFGGVGGALSYAIRLESTQDEPEPRLAWSSPHGSYVPTPLLFDGHLYWANQGGIAYCLNAETGTLVYRSRLAGGFFSSPILAGGRIYAVSREDGTYVLAARPELEVLQQNRFESDQSLFNATPAASRGQLFLRSDRALYCVEEEQGHTE